MQKKKQNKKLRKLKAPFIRYDKYMPCSTKNW